MTGFKWNIQDRSNLSMVCYARLYDRDLDHHRKRLWKELSNLNNRIVVLLPEWPVIRHRYHRRGDEIQDLDSLQRLYDLFLEEAEKIRLVLKSFPGNTLDAKVEAMAERMSRVLINQLAIQNGD